MNDYIKRKELLDELCRDNCERTYDGTCHNCRMTEIVADFPAADALSTLQAENEKLRAELEQVKNERDSARATLSWLTLYGLKKED